MKRFEYDITRHPADSFRTLVYFCSEQGACELKDVPSDQTAALGKMFNERGAEGWELVQVFFGQDGMVALWKREL